MTDPISAIARYLSADVRALGTLSQNVANLTTPGFRAVQRVESFSSTLASPTRIDLHDGALIHTGRALDLALQGPGFFQVQNGEQTYLTRSGQFKVDVDGQLVDSQGRAVLGKNGPITLAHEAVTISEDGSIHDGATVVDQLALVDVADGTQLQSLGQGLYASSGAIAEAQSKVHQGALEGSNVDPGHEMVRLMELSRHAGSIQHAISTYHATLVAGIDQIGKSS
ncbi:flagellar hook-basal body protein [Dyella silvatica]|uniref:flagellar hook-basal body protein n=1 Tax=Dyella silvatica TaxID=2992128 RepID=UPI00225BBB3D|nr:flagellar hook basal-body protein [Dyella silvatica]